MAPRNPLPYRERLKAIRDFHTGTDTLRDAGGPVTRVVLGPKWLIPPIVLATSPRGIRDIVSVRDGSIDKTGTVATELRRLLGGKLCVLDPYRVVAASTHPAAGVPPGSVSTSSAGIWPRRPRGVHHLARWRRTRSGRAVPHADPAGVGSFGVGFRHRRSSGAIAEPLRVATSYAVMRALRPPRAPEWMPASVSRRPFREAPPVHAFIAATDPETGQSLSNNEIRDETIIFLFAGRDTTATTLTYAVWALGRHLDLQERVAAEVASSEIADLPLMTFRGWVLRSRCFRRRCGCARRGRPGLGWRCATSKLAVTASKPTPCWRSEGWRCNRIRACGTATPQHDLGDRRTML
jgi:Cytochrome P450